MTALKILGAAAVLTLTAQTALAQQPPPWVRGEILSKPLVKATPPRVIAKVNGLVCDFCAQALKKVFGKEAAVESVDVDLQAGTVQITLNKGQQISDERVAELIRKSGYSLVGTTREGGA